MTSVICLSLARKSYFDAYFLVITIPQLCKIPKGHVTRCNFSCNLQRNSTAERCKLGKYASSLHFANVFVTYQTDFTN